MLRGKEKLCGLTLAFFIASVMEYGGSRKRFVKINTVPVLIEHNVDNIIIYCSIFFF